MTIYRWLLDAWQRHPKCQWPVLWLTQAKFLVGVAAVIFNEQDEVLLFRHTYRRLAWGLPSGWMGHGESAEEAIVREVAEETGLRVGELSTLHVATGFRHPRVDIVLMGRVEASALDAFRASAEVAEARFFAPTELPALIPSQRAFIDLAWERVAGSDRMSGDVERMAGNP